MKPRQRAIPISLISCARTPHIGPIKRIINVPRHPPRVTHRLRPIPRRILSPIAQRIQYRPPGFIQRLRHRVVPIIRQTLCPRLPAIITIIVFQIIDAPAGECLSVLRLVSKGAGVLAAGVEAGGAVHAEF